MTNKDPAAVPVLDLLLGYGPALLLAGLVIGGWWDGPLLAEVARVWASVILIFLAGVTRGLSFFTLGGPRPSQIAATMIRFALGFAGILLALKWASAALILGYASVLLYDPVAARTGAAPRHFARLRPPQIGIMLASLIGLFVFSLR